MILFSIQFNICDPLQLEPFLEERYIKLSVQYALVSTLLSAALFGDNAIMIVSLTRQDVYRECLIGARWPGAVRNTLSEVILSRVPARIRIETVIGCRVITGCGTVSSLVEPLLHFAVPFASLIH